MDMHMPHAPTATMQCVSHTQSVVRVMDQALGQNHEAYIRLASYESRGWLYVAVLVSRDLKSHHDLHVLHLKPSRGWQLHHALDLDLGPWRLVCGCLDRQNALCQAPLLLALTAEHSVLLDRSQAGHGARRGRVLVTRQYIRFSFVI